MQGQAHTCMSTMSDLHRHELCAGDIGFRSVGRVVSEPG